MYLVQTKNNARHLLFSARHQQFFIKTVMIYYMNLYECWGAGIAQSREQMGYCLKMK